LGKEYSFLAHLYVALYNVTVFFLVTIFLEKNESSLKLLIKRATFLIGVSTALFVIFPMKFEVYCREFKSKFLKSFFGIWGFLLAISVLFVYQHHLIDFVGGTLIFLITCILFPRKKTV